VIVIKKYIFWALALMLVIVFSIGGYRYFSQGYNLNIYALDTVIGIRVYGPGAQNAVEKAAQRIYELDAVFNRHNPQSEVSHINQNASAASVKVSDEVYGVLETALDISRNTGGAFDITIGPLSSLWNIGNATAPPSDDEINHLLPLVGYQNIHLKDGTVFFSQPEMQIDLGGIAKGYIGDQTAELLRELGIQSAVLDLGGNVVTIGGKQDDQPFSVAIKNPLDGSGPLKIVQSVDTNIVTSGGYERFFVHNGTTYHHILDPATGRPSNSDYASVTVIGRNGIVCDALSTAIFVRGNLGDLAQTYNVRIITLSNDGTLYDTEG